MIYFERYNISIFTYVPELLGDETFRVYPSRPFHASKMVTNATAEKQTIIESLAFGTTLVTQEIDAWNYSELNPEAEKMQTTPIKFPQLNGDGAITIKLRFLKAPEMKKPSFAITFCDISSISPET